MQDPGSDAGVFAFVPSDSRNGRKITELTSKSAT
jgi:hypothetical protein